MRDLLSMTMPEMQEFITSLGEKAFRAKQIYEWLHKKGAVSLDEMTNLPKALKEKLAAEAELRTVSVRTMQESKIDGTRKYLFRLYDGNYVESVWMSYHHGNTICISSQVGCRMGCSFCASTIGGLTRNLSAGEMLSQIYAISKDTGKRTSNVVIMGTGEPLDNYDNVVRFLHMISDEDGLNISERNLTLSTCGLVPGIRKLAQENLMVNLALSLHAPNDSLRREIMPVANSYALADIRDALLQYYESNHRRLTFEYALIRDVNDSNRCVEELAAFVKGINCLINLIPVNPVRENGYRETGGARIAAFKKNLEKYGINVTIRREMGRDIDGACGQLRKRCTELDNKL